MNLDGLEPSSRVKHTRTAAFGRVGNLTSLTGFLCQVPSEDPIQLLKEQMPRSPPLPHWQPLSEEADPPTKAG